MGEWAELGCPVVCSTSWTRLFPIRSGLSVRMKFKHKKETMLNAEENVWLDANVDLNQEG